MLSLLVQDLSVFWKLVCLSHYLYLRGIRGILAVFVPLIEELVGIRVARLVSTVKFGIRTDSMWCCISCSQPCLVCQSLLIAKSWLSTLYMVWKCWMVFLWSIVSLPLMVWLHFAYLFWPGLAKYWLPYSVQLITSLSINIGLFSSQLLEDCMFLKVFFPFVNWIGTLLLLKPL